MASERKSMVHGLAEADPWVGGDAGALDAYRFGRGDAALEIVVDLEHHVVIAGIEMHGLWLALGMHEDDGKPGVGRRG